MTCEAALELISASLDGESTPEEEARLQAHLAQCPRCRALQAELAGVHRAAEGEPEEPVPPELRQRVLEHLPAQRPAGKAAYWKRWGAMAAAVAVIALAAWRLPRFLFQRGSTADSAAQVVEEAVEETVEAPAENASQSEGYAIAAGDLVDGGAAPQAVDSDADEAVEQAARTDSTAEAAGAEPFAQARNRESEKMNFAAVEEPAAPTSLPADDPEVSTPPAPPQNLAYGGGGGGSSEATSETPEATASPVSDGEAGPLLTARTSLPEETPQWIGVLTVAEFTPGDAAVEVIQGEERRYILPANDFLALVRSLEESGAEYTLRQEGEDISPDAESGLVLLSGN